MTSARISRRNALVSITAIASTPAVGLAAKRDSVLSEINEADLVDFFAAKRRGLIATRFIPANSKRATVMMKNLTDRRLGVRLPTTFAGIPILGQFGGGGMGGMGGVDVVADEFPYHEEVEIFGIVYIYNPVNDELVPPTEDENAAVAGENASQLVLNKN